MALGFSLARQYTVIMVQTHTFLKVDVNCDEAMAWLKSHLGSAGLQVRRSFDFQTAREAHTDCPCPHHATNQCSCQLIVLLVYGPGSSPATLVVHSYDNRTRVSLVSTPGVRPAAELERLVRTALRSVDISVEEMCKHAP
ncbi:MAG: hypothetical protein IBX69_09730 [Anaerolineales bacterium]|nr:hypothetical protein [Anaerolineales bacterium]